MIYNIFIILALVSSTCLKVIFEVVWLLIDAIVVYLPKELSITFNIKSADFWGLKAIMLLVRHRVTRGLKTNLPIKTGTDFWGLG